MNENDYSDYEDSPKRQSMSGIVRFGYTSKASERYRRVKIKIKRWLTSHVGQVWNDVYSKACKKFDDFTLNEINYWVIKDVTIDENGNHLDSKGEPIDWRDFVVVDGILCTSNRNYKKYIRPSYEERLSKKGIYQTCGRLYYLDPKNIWYELILEDYNNTKTYNDRYHMYTKSGPYDEFFAGTLSTPQDRKFYYGDENLYCKKKLQMNKQEIKKLYENFGWKK